MAGSNKKILGRFLIEIVIWIMVFPLAIALIKGCQLGVQRE